MHSPIISEIEARIRHTRAESRKGREKEFTTPNSFPLAFADDVKSDDFLQPGDISGSERWLLPPSSPHALPPLHAPLPEDMGGGDLRLPAEIACWHSHFEVLRKIADGDDDVAIIFEDDVDMEWDLERRLRNLWSVLPTKWDIVMLGTHIYAYWSNLYSCWIDRQVIVWAASMKRIPFRVPRTYIHPPGRYVHMLMPCRRKVPGVLFGTYDHPSLHITCP
jgi:GR25 family glycosyltransferase involved in LPS biosynthesis